MSKLREQQRACLQLLKAFHSFCVAEGLTYFLAKGTLLGAVRHGGFIPWDDDADVVMLRSDYELFLRIYEKASGMRVVKPGDPGVYLPFTQVSSLFGGSLDIFPLDGVPRAHGFNQDLQSKAIRLLEQALLAKRGLAQRDSSRSLLWLVGHFYVPLIIGRAMSFEALQRAVTALSRAYEHAGLRLDYLCNHASGYPRRWAFPRGAIEPATPIVFEEFTFMGPADPQTVLTIIYGDYMVIPPPDARRSHGEWDEEPLRESASG